MTSLSNADEIVRRAESVGAWLAESAAHWDREGRPNADAYGRIRAERIGALRVPAALGGPGGTVSHVVAAIIALSRGDASVGQAMLPHFVFIERTRLMSSPEQSARLLSHIADGALAGGASAEGGGAFRGEIRTLLKREGAGFRLNGAKQYCTGALMGDLLKVTAVDEEGRSVLAVIPATRYGVMRNDDWQGMGQRGTMSGTTVLNDVYVASDEVHRVAAWKHTRHHTGAFSQVIHCAIDIGIAWAALDDAARWVIEGVRPVKESGVGAARDDSFVLHTLGRAKAHVNAADAMVYEAAVAIERAAEARFSGQAPALTEQLAADASIITAHAKAASTNASLLAAQNLFDVGGAATASRQRNFDRHWRNARTHTVHDPIAYKYRAIGDYLVNRQPPPIDYGY